MFAPWTSRARTMSWSAGPAIFGSAGNVLQLWPGNTSTAKSYSTLGWWRMVSLGRAVAELGGIALRRCWAANVGAGWSRDAGGGACLSFRCYVGDKLHNVLDLNHDALDLVNDMLYAGGRRASGLRWGGGLSGRPLPPRLTARG